MPNPDITTGSAKGGAGRVPGKAHRPKPKPKVVPHERPAPFSPDKVRQDNPVKVVTPKVLHPIDEVALRRQRLMRELGHPVVVDGNFRGRSQAAWGDVGLNPDTYDRKLAIERAAVTGAANMQGVRQQAAAGTTFHKGLPSYHLDPAQNLQHIHDLVSLRTPDGLTAATALATVTGVTRPGMTITQSVKAAADELYHGAVTRAIKARIDRALGGVFHPTDPDTLERMAKLGLKPAGLASLSGNDLAWLLANDGITIKQRFTETKLDAHGKPFVDDNGHPVRFPTRAFTEGLQGYANRMGVRINGKPLRVDGVMDPRTNDAIKKAAHIEQHQQEMLAYRDLQTKLVTSGSWDKAQAATGLTMSFRDAWRQARDGDPGWAALTLLSAAARTAAEDEPQRLYAQTRLDAFDAAQVFASGQVPGKGEKGPFAGTPYGLQPDAPPLLALASGVPETIAFSETRTQFDAFTAYLQQLSVEREFAEDKVRGTVSNDSIEYLLHREVVPVLDGNGKPKFTYTRYGTRVPVTEVRTWRDPATYVIRPAPLTEFGNLIDAHDITGAISIFPRALAQATMEAPGTPYVLEGTHQAGRPAEWVTLQVVSATMQAHDIFTAQAMDDLKQSITGGWMAGNRRDHDYDREARIWFAKQGFWTQMALTAVFDPLNFVGRGLKGVAILGRELEHLAFRRTAGEIVAARRLVDHGPSIASEDELLLADRAKTASLTTDVSAPLGRQFKPLDVVRRTVEQRRKLYIARNFAGVRGPSPEQIADLEHWHQEAVHRMLADPSSVSHEMMERHKISMFVDEAMSQRSDVGEVEFASRMVAARPAMLAMLRQDRFSDDLMSRIEPHVFGMVRGSLPASIANAVERIEKRFADAILDSMEVLERQLRIKGGYEFADDPRFTFADGSIQRTYRGPRLVDTPELHRYYGDLAAARRGGAVEGALIRVRNPGFGFAQTRDEMMISVNREVRRRVRDRMGAIRAEYRRTRQAVNEDELNARRTAYEFQIRREVESHWLPSGGATRAEQREALDRLDDQLGLAIAARDQSKVMLDHLVRERERVSQQLADLAQAEGLTGKLSNALAQLGLKGRLQHAAERPSTEDGLHLHATPDEAIVIRARRIVEEHTGQFDPRMAVERYNTDDALDALHEASGKILRDLNGGELPLAFNHEYWRETILRYADAEHPAVKRVLKPFKPGQKFNPSSRWFKKGGGTVRSWNPENAATAATLMHELAHTMAVAFGDAARKGSFEDALWDELVTSLIAIRLRKSVFPELDEDSIALYDGQLARGFSTYYYGEAASKGEAMLIDAAEGFMGFTADEVRPFVELISDMDADMPELILPGKEEGRAAAQQAREENIAARHAVAKQALSKSLKDVYDREQAVKAGLQGHAVDGTKDMEPAMRDVLAHAMTAGLARRGLFLSDDNIEMFYKAVSREGLDVRYPDTFRRLVKNLSYRHPTVQAAFEELDEAERYASRAFDDYFYHREHRMLDLTAIGAMKDSAHYAVDQYWKASDKLFSNLLRLQEPDYLERMALEFEGEYENLSRIPDPSREQKMVAIIHRASAKSLRNYLAAGQGEYAQIKEVNRAVTMLHRELSGMQRDIREHSEAYHSAAYAERGLRDRVREIGTAPPGTWFDTRSHIEVEHDPDVAVRSVEVGRIHDAHDGVAWAEGQRMQTGPKQSTVDLQLASNQRDDVFVRAGDFTVDEAGHHRFKGQVLQRYSVDDEGRKVELALPGDAIPASELTSGQLFQLFADGAVSPTQTLKAGPKRVFMGDELGTQPSAYVKIPKFVKGKVRMVTITSDSARRGVLPELGDVVRDVIRRQVEAGATLDQIDTYFIEELAKENPRYSDAIHLFANRQLTAMSMRGYEHARDVADKAALPSLLASQGLYISALSHMTGTPARAAYNTLNISMQAWKFATLPLSAMWLLANVVDNFAKRLISGLVDPKEMMLAPVRTGAKATGTLAHYSVAAVYQAARQGDRMFGTNVAEQLDGVLRAVTHYDATVRNTFLRAHDIDIPPEITEGGFTRAISSPLDAEGRRWDPLDWKGPWESFKAGNKLDLFHAFVATTWHLVGDLPETAARRAAYNVALRQGLKSGMDAEQAIAHAIHRVNQTLFDYNDIKVGEENLRFLLPFLTYWRKNIGYWSREVPQHPWIVSNLQRMEDYRSDPALPEGKDPLARYFDITGIVDDAFGWFGIDVPDGVGWDVVKLSSVRVMYELMFSSQNPNMPPERGGIEMVNRVLGYFDDIGLGINPYLRAGLQAFDIYKVEAWRSIFPQTSIIEGMTRQWWHEQYPDGINIERFLLDDLYKPFHDGKSLSDLRAEDINYYIQVEMSRQAAAGQPINRTKAAADVRGFFGVAAITQLVTGIFLRRYNAQDRELLRIRQMAKTDFRQLTPHQMAVNTVDRERFKTQEMMDRAVEAYPAVELYYRTEDWRTRQQILEQHPEISPYVQHTRAREQFATPAIEGARRSRRQRDQILATQRGMVMQIYQDLKGSTMSSDTRSRVYSAMMTPELKEYLTRTQTPQSRADAFVRGEFYAFMNKLSEAFHDIPEGDYARRGEFMRRNPHLQDYWTLTNPPEKDAVSILNAANAAYRSWYFTVVNSEGWDAAAKILEAHPQMFDLTKAAGRVDRATGKWLPRTMADLERHAADYRKFKPQLDEYFNQPPAARAHWLEGHPDVLAYFKTYGADRHFRRRHFSFHAFANASAPWARMRAEFWHRFFQLPPDQRVDFIKKHAAEFDVFAWGPTSDSQHTANAHAFAWGDTPRKDAYKQVAALMQVYFELKPEDRAFFLSANPEIQAYFEEFRRGSITGDKHLDKVLETYFDQPGKDAQRRYLDKHPELKAYFQSKRDTPEEKAIGVLLDAYFKLPPGAPRHNYLFSHPELSGFFDERKRQADLIQTYDDALTEADPRYRRYKESEEYLTAQATIRLRRAALRATTSDRATHKLIADGLRRPADPPVARGTRQPTS